MVELRSFNLGRPLLVNRKERFEPYLVPLTSTSLNMVCCVHSKSRKSHSLPPFNEWNVDEKVAGKSRTFLINAADGQSGSKSKWMNSNFIALFVSKTLNRINPTKSSADL